MIIDYVELFNVGKLFDVLADIHEDEEYSTKKFEKNIVELYNNVSIRYVVSSCSYIEYYHLKNILQDGSVSTFIEKPFNMTFVENTYPEISHDVRQVRRLASTDLRPLLIPAGCVEGSCNVILTGKDLSMFMAYEPMRCFYGGLFSEDSNFYKADRVFNREYVESQLKDGRITDEEIESKLIGNFLHQYYNSMVQNHQYIDLLSDYAVESLYYYPDIVKFISMNKYIGPETLTSAIKSLKGTFTNISDEIKLSFSIGTNFITFLKLYTVLHKHCFTSIQSLRFPHSEINNMEALMDSLNPDVYESLRTLKEHIIENYEVQGKEITYATMVFNYAPIHCTVDLTFGEIEKYITTLDTSIFGMENVKNDILTYYTLINKSIR